MIILTNVIYLLTFINFIAADTKTANKSAILNQTRRILQGHEVGDTRPYMVYLRPAASVDTLQTTGADWLCGGVIIHERYILTSAACIEDVKQFYVVSGTHRLISATNKNEECIKYGAKKAIWKCVPKTYYFDGDEFDNIRWMVKDIAVVKVEDDFNFERRVRGCDFIPNKIAYNNQSDELEKAGSVGSIAGWGSTDHFGSIHSRSTSNSPVLLESDVVLISNKNCKKRWDPRYHFIIENNMICAKDGLDTALMSSACSEHEVNCKDLVYSVEEDDDAADVRRQMSDPEQLSGHTDAYGNGTRRSKVISGGFCENDHGGPLVVGQGKSAIVIGVISACMTKDLTNKCYGPFLYTSVFRNRNLINCAIEKDTGVACRGVWRSSKDQRSETVYNWSNHPDGPAKSESHRRSYFDKRPQFRQGPSSTTTLGTTATEAKTEPTTTVEPISTTETGPTSGKIGTTTTIKQITTTVKTTTNTKKGTTTTRKIPSTIRRKTTTTKRKTSKTKPPPPKTIRTTRKTKRTTPKKKRTTRKIKPTTRKTKLTTPTTSSTTTSPTTTTTTEYWPRLRDMLYMLKTDYE